LRISLKSSLLTVAWLSSCAPKEAEDPKSILGNDLAHEGVYGGGEGPDSPRDVRSAGPPSEALASRADCEQAARHLVELGIDLAIREEQDPEKKQKLADDKPAALNSEGARAHVAEWSAECRARRTTRAEARCIASIRSESAIERCVGP